MRRLLFLVAFAFLAGCGGGDADEQYAGVARADAERKAEERAKKAEEVDDTPLSRVEVSKGTTREGADAWLFVYADSTGEFDDLCVWVNAKGAEGDDCPGYAGGHARDRADRGGCGGREAGAGARDRARVRRASPR